MVNLKVITHPNGILRKRSKEIDRDFIILKKTQQLIKDMIKTMYTDDGVGLAAPQVGENIRLVVIGKEVYPEKKELILINPTWTKLNRKKEVDTEGCLSIPKIFGKVKRYKNINVQAVNESGEKINFEANESLARVIQHEVDHLDGILFIDKAKDIYNVE